VFLKCSGDSRGRFSLGLDSYKIPAQRQSRLRQAICPNHSSNHNYPNFFELKISDKILLNDFIFYFWITDYVINYIKL